MSVFELLLFPPVAGLLLLLLPEVELLWLLLLDVLSEFVLSELVVFLVSVTVDSACVVFSVYWISVTAAVTVIVN